MTTLIDKITWNHDEETAGSVAKFFERANLPVPKWDETYATTDQGWLTFLTPFGCTVRITDESSFPLLSHKHILRPLYTERHGSLRLSVNPGVAIGAKHSELAIVNKELSLAGIRFYDIHIGRDHDDNSGTLPGSDPRHIVVLDTPGVNVFLHERHREFVAAGKHDFGYEEVLYGEIRGAFNNAMRTEEPVGATQARMNECWDLCASMKRDNRLLSMWEDPEHNHRSTWSAGDSYNQALSSHDVLRAIPDNS